MKPATLTLSGGPGLPVYVGSLVQTMNGMYEVTQVTRREHSTGFTAIPFGRPITEQAA